MRERRRLALTLALVIPRAPSFTISQDNTFTSTDPNPYVALNPPEFRYNSFISIHG